MEIDDWELSAEQMDLLERNALKQLAERKSSSVAATTSHAHSTNAGASVPSCRSPAKPAFLTRTSLSSDKQINASQKERILPASMKPLQSLNNSSIQHLANVQVKFFLHASGNVAAKFTFNQILVDAFRKIPGAIWNRDERLWKFPLSSLSKAESVLHDLPGIKVMLESLDPLVRRAIAAAAELPDLQDCYGKIPPCLESRLMPFQRDGVRFVLQHGGRALLADEMGLGKTLQAIAVASCFPEAWPVLVLTPSSLRLQWASMIQQWLNIDPYHILVVLSQTSGSNKGGFNIVPSNAKRSISLDGVFNIISYDIVPKIQDKLLASGFKVVIADESHFLKNTQAKRTISTIPILQKAEYVILLSGTPALSRPIELLKQLEALYPDVYRNFREYGERYCKGGTFGQYQGSSNKEELHNLMKATLMIRRLKKDVLSELPVKRRQQVFMDLEEGKLKQINALFRELEELERKVKSCQSKEEVESLTFTKKNLITKLYNDSAEAKIDAVLDYLGTVTEAGCKFLIFAHHQSMIAAIHEFLLKKKVRCIRIDGSTPAASRQNLVKEFQEDDSVKAAVLSIKAGGVGLTLTAASTVIFAELSWTPGDLIQAEDRAHRIGQESSVNVYYLLANDTVDDIIWDVVQSKLENLGQVLDGHDNCLQVDQSGTSPSRKRTFPVDQSGRSPLKQRTFQVDQSGTSPSRKRTFQVDQSGSSPLKQKTLDSFMLNRCNSTSPEDEPRLKYPKH